MSGSKPRSGWHEGRDSSWWTPRSPRSQASPRHPRRCDLARHGPRGRGGRRGPRCRVGEGRRPPPRPVALDREAPPGERPVQGGRDDDRAARMDPRPAPTRSRGCPDGRLAGLPEWIRTCDLRPRRADARSTELPGARATITPGLRLARPSASGFGWRVRATSWLDPNAVEDRPQLGEILRGRPGGPFRRNHQTRPFDVDDPELLPVARPRVAIERVPWFGGVDESDPALEAASDASGEAEVVSGSLDRQGRHGPFPMP